MTLKFWKEFFVNNLTSEIVDGGAHIICEAERSFSGLRRLKTWLRSTMMQKRLNGIAVCHIHQERLVFGSFSESAKTVNLFGSLFIHVKYAVVYTSECMFK